MVAALFVAKDGCYAGLPDVDVWDQARDARLYNGPHSIVAHPPCQRWGRFWSAGGRYERPGMDEDCFGHALGRLIRFGGVLEHPKDSLAWDHFSLNKPDINGGWTRGWDGLWTCCVEQGHYGHRARKATWLLYCGHELPPSLIWGPSEPKIKPRPGRDPIRERRIGAVQRMCKREREATPIPFRDLLLSLARKS